MKRFNEILKLPKFIIFPYLLTTLVYWISGIYDDFGVYNEIIFTLILCANIAISYGKLDSLIILFSFQMSLKLFLLQIHNKKDCLFLVVRPT